MLVPLREVGADVFEQPRHLFFRNRHDPVDDSADPLRISRTEVPEEDTRLVGLENNGRAFYGNGHYAPMAIGSLKLVTMFCARRISAKESRNAKVDSAP